jgi:hypothetical protein
MTTVNRSLRVMLAPGSQSRARGKQTLVGSPAGPRHYFHNGRSRPEPGRSGLARYRWIAPALVDPLSTGRRQGHSLASVSAAMNAVSEQMAGRRA